MSASQSASGSGSDLRPQTDTAPLASRVVDYEPPPIDVIPAAGGCPQPLSAALHRRRPRTVTPVSRSGIHPAPAAAIREEPPPRAAAVFAEAALRRVLEVVDRRRPIGQLRPMLAPALLDTIATLSAARSGRTAAAVLRRVRLRTATAVDADRGAAEVFATYSRGSRVRAIAARVEQISGTDRWQLVALQIG